MEKIVQMLDSNDAEIVILGCILFLQNYTPEEFPGNTSTNPTIYKHRTTNLSSVERKLAIIQGKKKIGIILYYAILHLTTDYQKTKDEYPFVFNELNTINI